jgi:hypothetical protein
MTSPNDIEANAVPVSSGHNVLRIISGLHTGASRAMADQEMILVGSGEDCDIVLADGNVAAHHALISLVNGRFSLRALDAPLHIGTSIVHPGDPVELMRVQRVGLGEAALAFGAEDDPGWVTLLPGMAATRPAPPRAATPYLRRLPAVAAVAVLSLASLAIFAAVMPEQEPKIDAREQLARLIPEYAIDDGRTTLDVHGNAVLTGTVRDPQTRDRIRQRVESEDITAVIDLRTGDDIANDVGEVLRAKGLTAKTRYLGNGDVEVSGRFEDEDALRAAVYSRAMRDVKGVNRVVPRNFAEVQDSKPEAGTTATAPRPGGPVRIVSIVNGKEPHLVDANGRKYPIGADLPGQGELISITDATAHTLMADGQIHKVFIEPISLEETRAKAAFVNVISKASPLRQ